MRIEADLTAIGLTAFTATVERVADRFDALVAAGPLTEAQREVFAALAVAFAAGSDREQRKVGDRIGRTLRGDTLPICDDDAWAAAARAELPGLPEGDAWLSLLTLSSDGAKPTKKWTAAAAAHVQRIGEPAFVATVRRWFALVAPRPVLRDAEHWYEPPMADANADALKNLVWACAVVDDPNASEPLATAIGDLAVRCFGKIRGVGALSMKVGNACIHVLSQLPGMRAVAQLSRLGSRVRYRQALALVEKAKLEVARRVGVPPIDLEELSLPTFGLDVDGRARIELGHHTAELAIADDKVTLTFLEGQRRLKAVPAAVKADHAEELRELKATHKELAALVPTVRARLERWFLEPRAWSLADLRARYLDHPLVAQLARRLVYTTADTEVLFFDGRPIGRTGTEVRLADDVQLTLWHPLGRPSEEVAAWRRLLASLQIVQPLRQVDRELYFPEDPAAIASTRFAGRRLGQHQLAALLRERGWTYRLMGQFDGANTPTKRVPAYDLTVELDVDVPEDTEATEAAIYLHVWTGEVRFLDGESRAVRLGDVPTRCFSEVLRDVDLFVTGAARS